MKISKLYKVDDDIVFYSTSLNEVRQSYYDGLMSGAMIGYDVQNNVMDAQEASDAFLFMADRCNVDGLAEQIYRNIELAPVLIAVVKEELIYEDNPNVYLQKLEPVIQAIQTGSLDTASGLLLSMIPDDVITTERLQRWASLCTSADAIEV